MKLRQVPTTARKPDPTHSDNWRVWYTHSRWRTLRARQLEREPLCRFCTEEGRVELATVVDHVTPHKGDRVAFWKGPFRSLCKRCHDSTAKLEQGGKKPRWQIGADGWPMARGGRFLDVSN